MRRTGVRKAIAAARVREVDEDAAGICIRRAGYVASAGGNGTWHKEPEAGIHGYTETVTIIVETDPGSGDDEDSFEAHMRQALAEWFDGARVGSEVQR